MYNADIVAKDFYSRVINIEIVNTLLSDENRETIVSPLVASNLILKKMGLFETVYLGNCMTSNDAKWLK
jgi:hypothetical protein